MGKLIRQHQERFGALVSAGTPNPSLPRREVRRDFTSILNNNAPRGAFEKRGGERGFAYASQAAVRLASRTLRIPRAMSAGTSLLSKNKALCSRKGLLYLAERGGFEPPVGYEPTHAFQACDLNHSSISPEYFRSGQP